MNIRRRCILFLALALPLGAQNPWWGVPIPDQTPIPGQYYTSGVVKALRTRYSDYIAVQAHRGLWAVWPENTKQAYNDAMNAGVEILEVDLRLCNGVVNGNANEPCIAVQHDASLGRVTTDRTNGLTYQFTAANYKNLWMKDRAGRVVAVRPLLLRDLFDYVLATQSTTNKSIVLVVDCKNINVPNYRGYDVFKAALKFANYYKTEPGHSNFDLNSLVWKLWLANLPTVANTFETDTGWSNTTRTAGQNLIVTVWPPNYSTVTGTVSGSQCGYNTPQVACAAQYQTYASKPYLTHFELISYYLNDPLSTWVSNLFGANQPMGDYWHENVLPEGISRSYGNCCLYTYTRSENYATSPFVAVPGQGNTGQNIFGNNSLGCFAYNANNANPNAADTQICPDQRSFIDRVLARNPTSIVTDKVVDLINYLSQISKRNLTYIQNP